MKKRKKVGILIIIILIVIQFVQPVRNISANTITPNDISTVYALPAGLHETFVNKCYDCHSNNTNYPWYYSVQPIGWWLAAHVHEGKEELNFSEFKTYDAKRADHKIEEIGEVIEDGSMPLKAYVMFHRDKGVTDAEKKMILDWVASMKK